MRHLANKTRRLRNKYWLVPKGFEVGSAVHEVLRDGTARIKNSGLSGTTRSVTSE